ncbi:hypothetical protein [Nonomuraea longicatena]|uniref:DUF4097 domain-containing protein n=1 Tax=Nonomuraea longicatena TaxID=83682 RepID=A0ABN1P172_9ACTN
MKALWRVVGSVATVAAMVISTAAMVAIFADADLPSSREYEPIPFSGSSLKVVTNSPFVTVDVVSGEAGRIFVERRMTWSSRDQPKFTQNWDPLTSTLDLGAECPEPTTVVEQHNPRCTVDYQISVPVETDLVAETGRGELSVSGLYGNLRLTSLSGNVRISGIVGGVWARSGSGSITAEGMRADRADVETGAGDLDLTFHQPPDDIRAVVRTEGEVRVRVPASTYNVTALGRKTFVNVTHASHSSRRIFAEAPAGRVELCC